jgi:large subunit ribosomal protein L24
MKVKIRKGDTVEVISGRLEDKGKRGEVINVILMIAAWWCRV